MKTFKKRLYRAIVPSFLRDERGLSTVEYTIILMLIAVAGIALWTKFGGTLTDKIENANTNLEGVPEVTGDI